MTEVTIPTNALKAPLIDPEFAALIPPLCTEERQLLEESILRDGCRDPLVVWEETNILLDGHNRLAICAANDIPFRTSTVSFAHRDEAKVFVLTNQLARRNLCDIDRIAIAAKREPLLKEAAAKNKGKRTDLVQNSAPGSKGRKTREIAAAAAGVSHDTYTKGKRVVEQGVPELVEAVRQEEVSIHRASSVAELPPEGQREFVLKGRVENTAKGEKNRRTQSSGNDEWGTPEDIIDAVRKVLGAIDVDPASNVWSQKRVKATHYYTKDTDGLKKPWTGRVFLNPPYSRGLIKQFASKLVDEFTNGDVTAAVLLVNNETDASWFQIAATKANAICFPKSRIRFLQPAGKRGSPLQGQALLYFGSDANKFVEVFVEIGIVLTPTEAPALSNSPEAKS